MVIAGLFLTLEFLLFFGFWNTPNFVILPVHRKEKERLFDLSYLTRYGSLAPLKGSSSTPIQ
jgi:hypothetical protein